MKIAFASDLHLEFAGVTFSYTEKPDVLVLAGDICVAERVGKDSADGKVVKDFFDYASAEFQCVLYVAGNHEFYHGKLNKTYRTLEALCDQYPNVYFLERNSFTVGDLTFVGGTMWTDLNRNDPLTQRDLMMNMNDYRSITYEDAGYTKLRPAHTAMLHVKTLRDFHVWLARESKAVVVTHHAPTFESISPSFKADFTMNGGYASDLSEWIFAHPQVKLWIHGHIHDPVDYMVGDCRVVSNPRGYFGYENAAKMVHELKVVEV